jgi:MerR family redox-sensitive transcriptional activator SoxR
VVEVKRYSIGAIAARAGVATSALRFYEQQGLIHSERTPAGHRVYHADVLRRVAFIQAAQRVGLSLAEIREALASLPDGRTPTRKDWAELSAQWRERLDAQIGLLERLRDDLTGCIGCGCLSLSVCALYNPDDELAKYGPGAHILLQDVDPHPSVSS